MYLWSIIKVLKFSNCISVVAINSLYTALGSPALPGWVSSGGDPCGQGWQGVQCNGSVIQEMYECYPFFLILHLD